MQLHEASLSDIEVQSYLPKDIRSVQERNAPVNTQSCHHAPYNGVTHNVVYIRWKSIYVTPEVDHEYLAQLRLNSGPESLVGQFTRVNEKCLSTLQQHSSAGLVVICRPWSFVFCFYLLAARVCLLPQALRCILL